MTQRWRPRVVVLVGLSGSVRAELVTGIHLRGRFGCKRERRGDRAHADSTEISASFCTFDGVRIDRHKIVSRTVQQITRIDDGFVAHKRDIAVVTARHRVIRLNGKGLYQSTRTILFQVQLDGVSCRTRSDVFVESQLNVV